MHINYVPNSFPKSLRRVLGIVVAVAVTIQVTGIYSFANFKPALAADTYLMYGVQDSGESNTQFFTLELDPGVATALGSEYPQYDIEGIDTHPSTGALYALAGGGGDQDGKFFLVDKSTGALTLIGDTGASGDEEMVSASFRNDGTLWSFQENVGIMEVNLSNGALTLKGAADAQGVDDNWEGLAWDLQGQQLYGAQGNKLYRWDAGTQTAVKLCENLPKPTEALDFRQDGKLFGGWHNADDEALSIFEINPSSCDITPTNYGIPYRDVESIAFVIEEPAKECKMEIEKIGTPGEVKPGENITYTIRIRNAGDADCTGGGVELKEYYDPSTAFVTSAPMPDDGNDTWNFGTVEPGEEQAVNIEVQASETVKDNDALINKACVWAEQQGDKSNPENWKCATVTTRVVVPPPPTGECTLEVTKTDDSDPVTAGSDLHYSVKVKNTGTADCTGGGVELKEYYDSRTAFITSVPLPTSGDNVWNFDVVEPGEEHVVDITVSTELGLENGDELLNKACAWAEQLGLYEDAGSWVCDEETTTVAKLPPTTPQLTVGKKVSDSDETLVDANTAHRDEILTYTIVVTNTGTATASDVMMSDDYSESDITVTDTHGGLNGGTAITWAAGDLPPSQSTTTTVTVQVKADAVDGAQFDNIAHASATGVPEVSDTVRTTVEAPPPPAAGIDLSLTKSANPTSVQNDHETVFTIMVLNGGPEDASGVAVTDLIPNAFVYVADTGAGAYNKDTGLWTVGSLAKNASSSIDIRVRARTTGTFENIAQVSAADQADVDSIPGNSNPNEDDQASATVKATEPPGPPGGCAENCGGGSGRSTYPKITIVKSVDKPVAQPGEVVTYTFTVTAGGDEASSLVTVTDTLPQGFTFVEGAQSSRTWDFGTMVPGASMTESYDVLIGASVASGKYKNVAVATIANGIPDDNRSEARATVEVTTSGGGSSPEPRLEVTKSASVTFTNPDTDFVYTVVVKNTGNAAALNVVVEDVLPTGFTFIDGGASIKVITVGDLTAGQSASVDYTVHAAAEMKVGVYTNYATARADNAGPASAQTDVEIREIEVLGFTTLPDTGTGSMSPLTIAFAAFAMLGIGMLFAYRYRILFKEAVREQVLINFIPQY
ncbi:MAG: DUF11 domain-containing protein [Patescibacteria group bacterium]